MKKSLKAIILVALTAIFITLIIIPVKLSSVTKLWRGRLHILKIYLLVIV
ncbi:MAG: hypothetical protein JSV88_10475 [Candidatus Aminicenantes bacterium]|nr:MAG: hypothetical protein JSV88_10475 [Candidatus Aminicenantes bacterium]